MCLPKCTWSVSVADMGVDTCGSLMLAMGPVDTVDYFLQ